LLTKWKIADGPLSKTIKIVLELLVNFFALEASTLTRLLDSSCYNMSWGHLHQVSLPYSTATALNMADVLMAAAWELIFDSAWICTRAYVAVLEFWREASISRIKKGLADGRF
jgi:hypothetical protein